MLFQGKTKGLVLGNYVLMEKLGQGGMGMVFKARHRKMGRVVALKVLSPSVTKNPRAVKRFQREAHAAAQLQHPNIVGAYDAGEDKGIHFLVMEYVDGSDLSSLVKKQGPTSIAQAVDCILQAAQGLAHAHAAGIVHRDIKPSNLLLASAGGVKVLDMGLARFDSSGNSTVPDELTQSGSIMGTCDYMAPEQALNSKYADQRSDVYSLGCTLYYLVTGKVMYAGETSMEKLLAHRETPTPALPGVSKGLQAVYQRMVAKDPKERYQSMKEAIAGLETVGGSHGHQVQASPVRKQARSSGKRWLLAGSALLLAGVGLVAILAGRFFASRDTKTAAGPTGKAVIQPLPETRKTPAPPGEIDLLKRIDPQKHAVKGQWSFAERALVMPTDAAARLQVPVTPPEEYELEAMVRPEADVDLLVLGLVAGNRQFMVALDAFNGKSGGLELIDGKRASENDTTYRGGILTKGKPSNVVVRVSRRGVVVICDGKPIIDWKGDFGRLSLDPSWTVPDNKQFFLGGWGCTYRIEKLVLRPLAKSGPSVEAPGVDEAWINMVQGLPPKKQFEAVREELTRRNRGYAGKWAAWTQYRDIDNVVADFTLHTDAVTDLSPLRALKGLQRLTCTGTAPGKGTLADLTPLRDLPLTFLNCECNPIRDLTPLQGMRLSRLVCNNSQVADLSPLKGMPLSGLECAGTAVSDLSPLQELPLRWLSCPVSSQRNARVLQSIKSLETINGKPSAEFWKGFSAKE
jgi:tRNA A-37 threonylcarbamoyl transferase component Bud32